MKEQNKHIIDTLKQLKGIDLSNYDDSFLNKSIHKRITETNCESLGKYRIFLEQNKDEMILFLDSLQISYSQFFRNSLTFSVLEHIIIPLLINKKKTKEIRIWSAACASGQEPCSIAMLLEEYSITRQININYRIFATDQSELQINEAIKGLYTVDSLNKLSLKMIKRWFTKLGDNYIANKELKQKIDFSVFDLFNDKLICPPASIFGDFDLIFCSNLLFYYKEEYRKVILEKTRNTLASGGYLITGETECDILIKHNYTEVYPKSAIFRI